VKTLSAEGKAQLASGRADKWFKVSIGGEEILRGHVVNYSFEYPRGDYAATANVTLDNEGGRYVDSIQVGNVLQIEEGLVVQGSVENFGGFYGVVVSVTPVQRVSSTLVVKAVDYIGRLKDLDIDLQIESPKTRVTGEAPTPSYLPAPNDNMAQVFTFDNSPIATSPPPIVYVYDKQTDYRFMQRSGYEIDYENGSLVLGNPINTDEFRVTVDYSYYPQATAYYVEDVMEQIITQSDGYGDTPFTVADHLTTTLFDVDGVTVDKLRPNYETTTIGGTDYAPGQVWYTSYNRIQDSLSASDFSLPAGVSIDSISEYYGRIILDSAISTSSEVTLNKNYTFRTIQATGIQLNYLSCRSKQIRNRWEALRAAKAILPPNYVIGTKQTSPGKIWGRYLNQEVDAHGDLTLETSREIDSDADVYTRVVLYGRNINPTDLCLGTDVEFVVPDSVEELNTSIWNAVDWSTQNDAWQQPSIDTGRCEIPKRVAIQSVNTLNRGTMECVILGGSNWAWRVGFITPGTLDDGSPQGVYFVSRGRWADTEASNPTPGSPPPINGAVGADKIACICRDASGETKVSDTADMFLEAGSVDKRLRIEWTDSMATFYINGRNVAEISTNLPSPPAHVVFRNEGGMDLLVGWCVAQGDDGGEVMDYFHSNNYIGRAYRHPLGFVEKIGAPMEGFRRYSTGILNGRILWYPPPLFYVNGVPLTSGLHQVTDAPVIVVEYIRTYTKSGGVLGLEKKVETDYHYEIHFSHRSLSPARDVTIYNADGGVWKTVPANTPLQVWVEVGTFLRKEKLCNRMNYGRGVYYITPGDTGVRKRDWWDWGYLRNGQFWYDHRQKFYVATADYYVTYSDDVININYEEGLVDIREVIFPRHPEPGERPEDKVEGTFYFEETYGTMKNAYSLLDGDMNTHAQMAFLAPPVPGHHLFTIDLGSEQSIDAIDIAGGFFIPPEGENRKLHVDMRLTLMVAGEDESYYLPCKEAKDFELSSGQLVTFDHTQLGDSFSARYLQVLLESTSHLTYGSPSGIWPVSIQQFRAYQRVILKAEAALVADKNDEDDTHLYDADGLLARVGDRVYKERDANQFLGTQAHLERVAKGMLKEFYKNHTRCNASVAFGPHYEQGATIRVNDPTNKITNVNYFIESVSCTNGERRLELARYP